MELVQADLDVLCSVWNFNSCSPEHKQTVSVRVSPELSLQLRVPLRGGAVPAVPPVPVSPGLLPALASPQLS